MAGLDEGHAPMKAREVDDRRRKEQGHVQPGQTPSNGGPRPPDKGKEGKTIGLLRPTPEIGPEPLGGLGSRKRRAENCGSMGVRGPVGSRKGIFTTSSALDLLHNHFGRT